MSLNPDPHWSYGVLPKIVNILAYLLFSGTHGYFAYSGMYQAGVGKSTYITPAPWAFWVWLIIHLLLFGTMTYQFSENGRRIVVEGISWRFLVLMILGATYVYSWALHEYHLAFLVSFVILFLVSRIYAIVMDLQQEDLVAGDEFFIYIPFSFFYDWTVILIFLSGFAAFGVNASTHPAGTGTKICTFLTFLFLSGSSGAGGLFGSIATVWYLWAVFVHQTSSGFVHQSVLAFAVLASMWVGLAPLASMVMVFIGPREALEDEERTPLLEP